jgi:RNA polymerase sigma factor (sigma-70 family)
MESVPKRPAFPSTRWSRILAPGGAPDLDGLLRSYGGPIEAYLRARLRGHEQDAADVAQDAMLWILTSGLFAKADPARGRVRGLLKKALANFAIEHLRRATTERKGGGVRHAPLDDAAGVADPAAGPDRALDDAWRRELLERANEQLRGELQRNGRERYWEVFGAYFLPDGDQPTHQEVAEAHGISRADVSNWLDHSKRRFRAILRELVADTVSTPDELADELRWLFAGVRPDGAGT